MINSGSGERWRDAPGLRHAVTVEPRRERLLAIGASERIQSARRLDLTAQRSSAANCSGVMSLLGELAYR